MEGRKVSKIAEKETKGRKRKGIGKGEVTGNRVFYEGGKKKLNKNCREDTRDERKEEGMDG